MRVLEGSGCRALFFSRRRSFLRGINRFLLNFICAREVCKKLVNGVNPICVTSKKSGEPEEHQRQNPNLPPPLAVFAGQQPKAQHQAQQCAKGTSSYKNPITECVAHFNENLCGTGWNWGIYEREQNFAFPALNPPWHMGYITTLPLWMLTFLRSRFQGNRYP